MKKVLITWSSWFIWYHLGKALLERWDCVIWVDNENDYYDPDLKKSRRELLEKYDERGVSKELIEKLGLQNSVHLQLEELSGGELQRLAVAVTSAKDADFYFFDEPHAWSVVI